VFSGPATYRGAYGGRGSGKSFSFALMAAVRGYAKPMRILCARELQNSIRDSVHNEVVSAIESRPWLRSHYDYGESYIRGRNGTEFIFKGIRHNYRDIKSTSKISLTWAEEAEAVSDSSWRVLIPTVLRMPGSELWITWNPESYDSSTHKRFIRNPPQGSRIVQLNYTDNPWFPEELEKLRQHDLRADPEYYNHIWLGECITRTDAQIFAGKWVVDDFTPQRHWAGPYFGCDFGFAHDPTALVKCWINDNRLYIEGESYVKGLELDKTKDRWEEDIPGCSQHIIRADSSRPESISHLKSKGIKKIIPVNKWKGSVEDGIAAIRAFDKVIIHSRCEATQREARLYSYKIDRISGDVLPIVVDANNHIFDGVRYALEPIITRASSGNVVSVGRRKFA
jgi:phage terminase large subunit